MSEEQFDRELKFQVSMALVDEMLEKGIIGQEDYEKWLRHMTQKYNPPIGRVVSKKSSTGWDNLAGLFFTLPESGKLIGGKKL